MRKMTLAVLIAAALMMTGCSGSQDGSSSAVASSSGSSAQATTALLSDRSQAASSAATESSKMEEVSDQSENERAATSTVVMKTNRGTLAITLADTEAVSALVAALQNGPISVDLHSYGGFEKVGALPQALPTSDEEITTGPGDVMLYQGSQITVFYGSNTWAYTPLGHIEDATAESLLDVLGDGDVTVELSL